MFKEIHIKASYLRRSKTMLNFIKSHKKTTIFSFLSVLFLLACFFSRPLTLLALDFYDTYITPHNGECAYRVLNGGCSCSEYFRDIVDKEGVASAVCAMPKQFHRCYLALKEIKLRAEEGDDGDGNGNGKWKWKHKKRDLTIGGAAAAICCGVFGPWLKEKTSSSENDTASKKDLAAN